MLYWRKIFISNALELKTIKNLLYLVGKNYIMSNIFPIQACWKNDLIN